MISSAKSLVRSFLTYLVFIAVLVGAILVVLHVGESLPQPFGVAQPQNGTSPISGATLQTLLLQIVLTLLAARALSIAARWLGQPAVVGEIAGGIVRCSRFSWSWRFTTMATGPLLTLFAGADDDALSARPQELG